LPEPFDPAVSRRAVLVTGVTAAGMAALAACAKGGSAVPGATPTATSGHRLVALSSVPVGGAVSVTLPDGTPLVVAQPTQGTVACFSAVCTHQGCTVEPSRDKLECPCHGSVYAAATGKVLQGPAALPLPAVPVRLDGGEVVTA
jgi:Rieske Fe-S protein